MATNGYVNTTAYNGRYLRFWWSKKNQSYDNNTTTIEWMLEGLGGTTTWYNTQNIKVTIDGKTIYSYPQSEGQIKLGNDTLVAEGTYTIAHNSDGTKSFTVYVEAGIYEWAVNCKGSDTFTLDTIILLSQPSCITWPEHTQNVGNFGDEISIHMNRKNPSCTHTVRYQFGSRSGTIATGVTTGTTWTIPLSLMELIPNSTKGSGTIYVETYYGSKYRGTKSCGFTATVPKVSQPSCVTSPQHTQNVGNFGDTITIYMNRNLSAYTHTVRYQFGSKSGTIATGVTTSTTWEIPKTLMELIPNSTSGSGTIYVDTYYGSTKMGTKSCGFTATVPSDVKPVCSLTLEDTTGIDDIYGSPVQGLSKIKVSVGVITEYNASVKSCQITANGQSYSGLTATTGVLAASGDSVVKATVKDSRGRTASASYTMKVQAYSAPAVTAITAKRCNQDGTLNKRGSYVKVTFSAKVSSMDSKNTAAYKLKYKKTSASSYTTVAVSALANKYAVSNHSYIFAADLGSSYDVTVEVADRHKTTTRGAKAPTAISILSWRGFKTSSAVEDGIGIGKVPEKANTLQVGWDAEFDKSVKLSGNTYAFQPGAFNGDKGYTLLAQITLNTLNVNAPIVFKINRRGAACPMTVYARFASSSTSTDPDLASLTYEGDNYGAFMVKTSTSAWKLYVDNTGGWSNPCLQEWYTTDNQMTRISVEFPSEQIATLPNPYYRATPLVSRSILDCFYPVGYILLLYSHADPNTMYPGSKWVRIYGAFPWFTDENGQIGLTGGERTVTLTEKQIPSHNHGGTYTNAGTARTHAWLASGGSAMGYDTINTGGGEAHNNMPPYIQISAWRRTE